MPVWLTIILSLGGSALIGLVVTDIYKAIKAKSKKHIEATKREKQEEMREVLTEELNPLKSELKDIKGDLEFVKDGLQKDLYVDLKNIYVALQKKGFATLEEKRDYNYLYNAYHNLGQNGIADGMHDKIMHMPEMKKTSIHKNVKVSEKSEGDK